MSISVVACGDSTEKREREKKKATLVVIALQKNKATGSHGLSLQTHYSHRTYGVGCAR